MNAFITAVSAFLPGKPVGNEELGQFLGEVDKVSARTRQIILTNNGIETRHYAIDPETGAITHTNAQLTAEAVRLLPSKMSVPPIECLCCGTSSADQLMPGHASMVHGELGIGPCEIISTAGVCLTGITALKYGVMSVALGLTGNAVATGSELASTFMRTDFFQAMNGGTDQTGGKKHHQGFSFAAEFLRWMLSDGAGAVLIEKGPASGGVSLKVDWIEILSHAHRLEACMYAGAVKQEDGSIRGWREYARAGTIEQYGVFTIKQDARLLNREVIPALVGQSLPSVIEKHGLKPEDIDWFLPHYSSEYFREPLLKQLQEINFAIPQDRWFTNLGRKGNTGSASFYIMLEELFSSGKLRRGERILGMIPESGRFSVGYVLLTVV
ncbi:3-oxoacyl-[acyl-carrier-protein] synthase 3 [bacterium BMS3Bbin14]|nr:3-oxoacyl-[acyl-carrier-protein] synthase 3 [bacterium BMS3Abin13]GBE53713.1 3-oxoacyl-[acyl-carrier-protein] synthase 3 [bacterium BMS3Bbin14]HDL98804.1 StlD/DarB family beta-ketosynthase [Desulfobacteraceae bacterium]HDO31341.1 StlD/DarB family beta-ketosynthase [Desulfobacteraceae bacterium]HDZ76333.1 StlD/DarB family beta-ketosynthase [Desulfobacteraceae bacterium]